MNKRAWLIPVFTLMFAFLAATFAMAAEGWVQNGNNWNYYDRDGNKVYDTWKKDDEGNWRWLDYSGNMAVSQWVEDSKYIDANGIMCVDTWQKFTDGTTSYWCYFASDGQMVTDKWKKVQEKWYYFDEDGHMLTGWILDNTYYSGSDGTMKTGWQYVADPTDDGDTSTYNEDDHGWYYFLASGKVFKPASGVEYTTKKIDGVTYCFNEDGKMQTGWVKSGSAIDDAEITAYRYYNADGGMVTGWLQIAAPEDLDSNYETSPSWFYFGNTGIPKAETSGKYTTADITRIGDYQYMFDSYGTPVYGLHKIYSSDASSEYNVYYFGTSENVCVQKGKHTIEEDDGEMSTFYFGSTGRGYHGVYGSSLYYYGKLQKADTGSKYMIISFPTGSGKYTHYLVNTSGTIMKNRTNIKDADENKYTTNSLGVVTSRNGSALSSDSSVNSVNAPYVD